MMWPAAAVLVLALVGLPFLVLPAGALGVLAVPSAVLCAAGLAARSTPLLGVGATVAVIEYAAALRIAGGPPDFLTAILFGVALFLLVELVDFLAKARGAAVAPSVAGAIIRYWLGLAGIAAGIAVMIVAGAGAVRLAMPWPSYPAAVVVGAVGAFIAAVGVLKLMAGSGNAAEDRKDR